MLKGFHEKRLFKSWKELFRKSSFTALSKVMALYMLFDTSTCQFQVLAGHYEVLSQLSQQKIVVNVNSLL